MLLHARPHADIRATTDEATPVNIFSHPYFNLGGVAANDSSVLDHVLTVNASHYMATDDSGAATGAFDPVAGTPLDFSTPHTIGERINGREEGLQRGGICSWKERQGGWQAQVQVDRSSGCAQLLWWAPGALLLAAAPSASAHCRPIHLPLPTETDGGYSAAYLLFGTDPEAAAELAFQAAEE